MSNVLLKHASQTCHRWMRGQASLPQPTSLLLLSLVTSMTNQGNDSGHLEPPEKGAFAFTKIDAGYVDVVSSIHLCAVGPYA